MTLGKYKIILVIFLTIGFPLLCNNLRGERILQRIELAASWQMKHPATYSALEWHWAPFYTSLTDLYEVTGKKEYLNYVRTIGGQYEWKIQDRLYHADDHAVGLSYIKLYEYYKQPEMISSLKQELNWILIHPPSKYILDSLGNVRKCYNRQRWNWSDALYMAPPVWAGMSAITGSEAYIDYMVDEWKQSHEWFWSTENDLYFHDRRDITKVSPGGKPVFWARGDGWVHAGLVEVLQYLPVEHPDREFFISVFTKMSNKLLSIQKVNGTWAPSLLDINHPSQDDISGSVFYVYALAWGINNNLLSEEVFGEAVTNGWLALCERQDDSGRLKNIQPVGGFPETFDPNNTDVFGVGGFISAGAEVYKMLNPQALIYDSIK